MNWYVIITTMPQNRTTASYWCKELRLGRTPQPLPLSVWPRHYLCWITYPWRAPGRWSADIGACHRHHTQEMSHFHWWTYKLHIAKVYRLGLRGGAIPSVLPPNPTPAVASEQLALQFHSWILCVLLWWHLLTHPTRHHDSAQVLCCNLIFLVLVCKRLHQVARSFHNYYWHWTFHSFLKGRRSYKLWLHILSLPMRRSSRLAQVLCRHWWQFCNWCSHNVAVDDHQCSH